MQREEKIYFLDRLCEQIGYMNWFKKKKKTVAISQVRSQNGACVILSKNKFRGQFEMELDES